jgi:pyridoxine 5-phosphate synthase
MHLNLVLDGVAALRQRRLSRFPDPLAMAMLAEQAGIDGLTLWLRESRTEVQDRDVERVAQAIECPLNLRIAATDELLAVAEDVRPARCCIVPERRHDHAPGGGLDATRLASMLATAGRRLAGLGIQSSARIDPVIEQAVACARAGLDAVELHCGAYALASGDGARAKRLEELRAAARAAAVDGLAVYAGGGLDYHNVVAVAQIGEITELRIGHAIIANALVVGLGASIAALTALLTSNASEP